MAALSKSAKNDRRRLTANFANTIAVAFVVTGVIIPAISLTYQATIPQTRFWPIFALIWFAVGIRLHVIGRDFLKGIEE